MAAEQTTYVGLSMDDNEASSGQSGNQRSKDSRGMTPPKSAYVGVAMEDIDMMETTSIHTTRSQTSGFSRFSRTSQTSYRSNIAILTSRAQVEASQAASSVKNHAKQVFTKEYWRTAPSRTKQFWKEAWADFKVMRVGHYIWRFTNLVLPIAVIITLCILLRFVSSKNLYPVINACRPDAGFYVGDQPYNIWAIGGFFQITLGFGDFGFSNAKIIDVAWDVRCPT